MSTISDNLKHLRLSHGLTQAEFGEIAGVSDKAVSTWENGIKLTRMGCIQKIADHFNISTASILEDAGPYVVPPGYTPLSETEYALVTKFRTLDSRGQSAVLNTLEHEYAALFGEGPSDTLSKRA